MAIHEFHHEVSNVQAFKQQLDSLIVAHKCVLHSFEEKKEENNQFNVHFSIEGEDSAISEIAKAIADKHE